MTKNQRDYLADLAGQKGVRLSDTDNWSVAKASEEIERLKELPDVNFDQVTDGQAKEIDLMTAGVLRSLGRWNFQK